MVLGCQILKLIINKAPNFIFAFNSRLLYELDQHLEQILKSTSLAKINLQFDWGSLRKS